MAHPYKGKSQHEHGRAKAAERVKGYDSGGAVPADRERNHRVGVLKMKLQGNDHNDWFPSNYRLANQGEKDRRETLNISRQFRKEDDPQRARGGRLGMTAGSESGVGRLQKAKKY